MKIKNYILTLTALLFSLSIAAQSNRNRTLINAALHGWEYEIRAGFNIGGTLPQPFPEEIRSIDSYTPTLSVSIEGNMTKWLGVNDGESLPASAWKTKECAPKQL